MPSKQSEAIKRRWEMARLAMVQPDGDGPDDESWGDLTAEPRGVDYLETEAGSRPAMWAVPKRSNTERVLLCIHGGGFVSGSIYTHRKMFGHLAKATGARALLVDYRLLPEGVYPAPVDDVEAAYRWFENADTAALKKALRTDAAIELVGTGTWFSGRATCLHYLAHVIGSPGDWLMIPTLANGQPAVATYHRDGDGKGHALGVAVLTVTLAGIARITVFGGGPELVARFGLPSTYP